MKYPVVIEQLIHELGKLPSIGHKTATRLAFSLLSSPSEEVFALADALNNAKRKVCHCKICFGFAEAEQCPICDDPDREKTLVCIVENPKNIFTIESSGIFQGVYHVLEGAISPLHGIGPEELRISELELRVETGEIQEIILATNPTLEGEATAHYLTEKFVSKVSRISRLARGMPSGGDLEFTDANTLVRAFEGRTTLKE